MPADQNAPDTFALDRRELTEENFDEAYGALVGQYDKTLALQGLPGLNRAGDSSPGILSGYSGSGKVYLTHNEDTELNVHLPVARDATLLSTVFHSTAARSDTHPGSEGAPALLGPGRLNQPQGRNGAGDRGTACR